MQDNYCKWRRRSCTLFSGNKTCCFPIGINENSKIKIFEIINDHKLTKNRFEWQEGYVAFSYSHSHTDNVYKYIENQERHHVKQNFKEEYLEFLDKFEVPFNEQYLFEDLK